MDHKKKPRFDPRTDKLEDFLRDLLRRHSRTHVETIRDEDRVTADSGLDSMALLETVLDVEEALDITIAEDKMPTLVELNFVQFVAFVRGELQAKGAAV